MKVKAEIEFLKVEDPDCHVKHKNGCRPIIRYEGQIGACCLLEFSDREEAFEGETVLTRIYFLTPEIHEGKLSISQSFDLYAGKWRIATGKFSQIE